MGRVSGKVAIVTGGARGIGEAIARLFVAEGAKVMIADILDEAGHRVAAELGADARYHHLDVRSEAQWNDVIAATETAFGPVSILVNNAGIGKLGLIKDVSEAEYREVIDVNQIGVFLGIKTVLESMRRAGGGSIVNMSSAAGFIGSPTAMAYTASKFAVRGMTKVAAIEYGPENIRVNSVHPGPIKTEMAIRADGTIEPTIQQFLSSLPAGRMGEPIELAQMVLTLASDEVRFATGAEFLVDGGWVCQ